LLLVSLLVGLHIIEGL
jgi:hypothetical protein